jgi:hypothetical protein
MKVFIAHSSRDRQLVEGLVSILREEGHDIFEPTAIAPGGSLLSEISSAIRSADVLVAVVTGANANVFYELGLAAGASVPTLVTAPAGELLPGDLGSVPYVQLTGDILRDSQTVARRVSELKGLSLTKPTEFDSAEAALRDAIRDPRVLEALSPSEFEHLLMELFKQRGYSVIPTGARSDTGVDFAIRPPNRKELVLVELKKLSRLSRVSVDAVRTLLSAVSAAGASHGTLISTSGYTAAALSLASGSRVSLRTLEQVVAADLENDVFESESRGMMLVKVLRLYFGPELERHNAWIMEFADRETLEIADKDFGEFVDRVRAAYQAPVGHRREAPKEELLEHLRMLKREFLSSLPLF